MVPPDCLEPVLKAIINNFVTERNSSEVMAVGLNAVRELCARYCRVFVQIFPTPSDCQVSSCDDWRSSEGSSRVWDVCTRTKPWWLIVLSSFLSISINLMQVKGVIEEENNLFVLLHDNEVWVKATAGNVVKELFAKGAYEFGDIVNVIWSSSWCISGKFLICFCVNNVWISSDHDDQARQFATLGHVSSTRSDATGALQHHRRFLIFFTIFCTIHVFSCVFQSYHFCILFFALVTIWFILGRGVWGRRRLLELWRSFNCSHSSSCFRWVAVGKSQNDILKMHI